jgi:hypothetical protein
MSDSDAMRALPADAKDHLVIGYDDFRTRLPSHVLVTLLDYWSAHVGQDGVMARAALNPADIVSILPNVFIMDVVRDGAHPQAGLRFGYRLVGTAIQEAMHSKVVGRTIDAVRDGPVLAHLNGLFTHSVQDHKAGYGISALVGEKSAISTYHRLSLPMSTDGRRVDQILGGLVASYENPLVAKCEKPQWPNNAEQPGQMMFASAQKAA